MSRMDPEARDYQASMETLLGDIARKVDLRRMIVNDEPRARGLSHVEVAQEIAGLAQSLHYMANAAAIVRKP